MGFLSIVGVSTLPNELVIYFDRSISTLIGVGRFRILGGPRFRIWGGKGGPNSQQAHDVVTTSMGRNDVASTSFRRRVPIRFLINQCQIITFLILKYDIIENSRIELRGIVLPVQMGGLLGGGGGGPKGMLAPPLSNYWGAWPPLAPPLPTPMTLLLVICFQYYARTGGGKYSSSLKSSPVYVCMYVCILNA